MEPTLHIIGPALHFVAQNPTVAAGAGFTFLGATKGQTTFNPGTKVSSDGNDLIGDTPMVGNTFVVGHDATLSAMLLDETKAKLKAYMANAMVLSAGGGALGLAAGLQKLKEFWLVSIPIVEAADGIGSENAIWMPGAYPSDFGQITRGMPSAGGGNSNPRTTVFKGAYRTHVLDALGADDAAKGEVLPQGANIAFIGSPTEWGIANIVLPDLAQFVPAQVGA